MRDLVILGLVFLGSLWVASSIGYKIGYRKRATNPPVIYLEDEDMHIKLWAGSQVTIFGKGCSVIPSQEEGE